MNVFVIDFLEEQHEGNYGLFYVFADSLIDAYSKARSDNIIISIKQVNIHDLTRDQPEEPLTMFYFEISPFHPSGFRTKNISVLAKNSDQAFELLEECLDSDSVVIDFTLGEGNILALERS